MNIKKELLVEKLGFANQFKSTICKLVKLLQSKRPGDFDIKVLGEKILTVHSINECEIIDRAGPIILKYKDLLQKVNDKDIDIEKIFWSMEESELMNKSEDKKQFEHILKCVAEEAKMLKPAERIEIAKIGAELIKIYCQYILVEKKIEGIK